jgi:hypothetical protein
MNWSIVFSKGLKGALTLAVSFLMAQIPVLTEWIVGLVPEQYAELTIAGAIAFLINAGANWLKHRTD